MPQPDAQLPVAGLAPRPITMEEYANLTPEKLELWSGYLIGPPEMPEPRVALLALLMVNVGLAEVVRLAPRSRWLEALDAAYGPEAR